VYTTLIAAKAIEPILAETLASVAAQTMPPERVMVIVEAHVGVDETGLGEMRRACPNVEIHRNPGEGQVPALAWGITQASTPYVAFLDADDLWRPDKQRLQVSMLEADGAVDAVTCLARNFRDPEEGEREFSDARRSMMFTSTTFRTSTFDRFGLPDPAATHFGWLYRWWGAALAAGISTQGVDYVGLDRRLHPGNSWTVNRQEAHRVLFAEVRRHVNGPSS
jgi:glycosyltransferase involved in cell wall biosynthesis